MTHLFTIICEYKGGTYTKQLSAENPVRAFEQWAQIFITEAFLTTPEKAIFTAEVQSSLTEGNTVALQGLQNVWYESFSLGDDMMEVIIVGMTEQPIKMTGHRN